MIGGYYVTCIEAGRVCLYAGPFPTYADADAQGAKAFNYAKGNMSAKDFALLEWGIAEFYFRYLVPGVRNKELWIAPNGVTK